MSTARQEIMAEAAEWLATPGLVMVDELTDVSGMPRTVFVGAATVAGVEGIVHVVCKGRKRVRYFAKFTSDAEYEQRALLSITDSLARVVEFQGSVEAVRAVFKEPSPGGAQ